MGYLWRWGLGGGGGGGGYARFGYSVMRDVRRVRNLVSIENDGRHIIVTRHTSYSPTSTSASNSMVIDSPAFWTNGFILK